MLPKSRGRLLDRDSLWHMTNPTKMIEHVGNSSRNADLQGLSQRILVIQCFCLGLTPGEMSQKGNCLTDKLTSDQFPFLASFTQAVLHCCHYKKRIQARLVAFTNSATRAANCEVGGYVIVSLVLPFDSSSGRSGFLMISVKNGPWGSTQVIGPLNATWIHVTGRSCACCEAMHSGSATAELAVNLAARFSTVACLLRFVTS